MRAAWLVLLTACGRIDFDAIGTTGPIGSTLQLADPGNMLHDYPLLVTLDDTRAARDLMQADASDLRFLDDQGKPLSFEIEQVGTRGGPPLLAWVRVPTVTTGTTTTITVTYGPDAATIPLATTSAWPPQYAAVYHMHDTTDSTAHAHTGTWLGGAMTNAAGEIASGLVFDAGSTNAVQIANSANFDFGSAFTASGWINAGTFATASGYTCLISRENGASTNDDFWLGLNGNQPMAEISTTTMNYDLLEGTSTLSLSTWAHLVSAYDGTTLHLYRDGALESTTAPGGTMLHAAHPIFIGGDRNTSTDPGPDADLATGTLDEIRLENIYRGATWISYDDRAQRDGVITYGPVTR